MLAMFGRQMSRRDMVESNKNCTTVNKKCQVTISASVRKQLGIHEGTVLIEVVIGNCLVLIPESTCLHQLQIEAAAALERAGLKPGDIIAEADHIRNERFSERYPGIGE